MIPIVYPQIFNRGYNNSSGLNYYNCGLAQYTPNEYKQVDAPDTATFENEKREAFLEKTMNEGVTDDPRLDAQDRAVERDIEKKEDPSEGSGNFRIETTNPMRLQAQVSKQNFKADESLNKNIPLTTG